MIKNTIYSPLSLSIFTYFLFISLVITLLPFRFAWPTEYNIFFFKTTPFDFIGNIGLFLPLGFLYQLRKQNLNERFCFQALTIGLFLSFLIEFGQLFLVERYTSLVDLFSNGLGCWLGAMIFQNLQIKLKKTLVNQLSLELPLMSLLYLLTPMLWLTSISSYTTPERLWLNLPLGLMGSLIFLSVWLHRLKPVSILSANTATLVIIIWFSIGAFPCIFKNPLFYIYCTIIISLSFKLGTIFLPKPSSKEQRFEVLTLSSLWPLFAIYMLFLANYPWNLDIAGGKLTIGLSHLFKANPILPVLRLVEYITAFTVFGYMLAESKTRNSEAFTWTLLRVVGYAFITVTIFEICQAYKPGQSANLSRSIFLCMSSLYGALIYRTQLNAIKKNTPLMIKLIILTADDMEKDLFLVPFQATSTMRVVFLNQEFE